MPCGGSICTRASCSSTRCSSPASRTFQVATQIASLELRDAIAALAAGARFADDAARRMFERHLTAYFAAALIMPYGRFLRACEATGYDLPVLQRRFGVGFESLAHRLTTLQRVGQRGLPFFMARIDRAGQFSKRYRRGERGDLARRRGELPAVARAPRVRTGGRTVHPAGPRRCRRRRPGALAHRLPHRRGPRRRRHRAVRGGAWGSRRGSRANLPLRAACRSANPMPR